MKALRRVRVGLVDTSISEWSDNTQVIVEVGDVRVIVNATPKGQKAHVVIARRSDIGGKRVRTLLIDVSSADPGWLALPGCRGDWMELER